MCRRKCGTPSIGYPAGRISMRLLQPQCGCTPACRRRLSIRRFRRWSSSVQARMTPCGGSKPIWPGLTNSPLGRQPSQIAVDRPPQNLAGGGVQGSNDLTEFVVRKRSVHYSPPSRVGCPDPDAANMLRPCDCGGHDTGVDTWCQGRIG